MKIESSISTGNCTGRNGALIYASMSIVTPDLKSMVKRSSKTVIFVIRRLTSVSSNSVMVVGWLLMKSCRSWIRRIFAELAKTAE